MFSNLLAFGDMLNDIKKYFANFDGTTNICRTIALWITIALVVAFAVTKIYLIVLGKVSKTHSAESIANANKLVNGAWVAISLIFAAAYIIAFATCYFVDVSKGEDTLLPIVFYPLLVFVVAVVASAAAIAIKPLKLTKIIGGSVCGAALIAAMVCMIVYYASGEAGEALSNVGLYISAVALIAAIIVLAFLSDRNYKPFDARSLSFAAVCVALSFALSYVRFFKMPMGGSITFASMLPIMLFSFMFGSRKGTLAGLVYGVLQAVQDPWIIHPAQFALDYAVAFAAVGLAGCIRGFNLFSGKMRAQFALGAVIAGVLRFVSHYFSGVFAFGAYGAGYAEEYGIPLLANEYFYSFVYQCMYVIPEFIIVTVVGVLLLSSGNFRKQVERYSDVKAASKPLTESESKQSVPETHEEENVTPAAENENVADKTNE